MAGKTIGEAFLRVRPDVAGFAKAAQPHMEKAGKDSGNIFTRAFRGALAGVAAGFAAILSGREVINFVRESINEQRDLQAAARITEAVLKSTGGAARISGKQITELDDRLGLTAGVMGDVVRTSSNLLLSFTAVRNSVGKGNDIFNRAQQSILDMTAAMHQGEVTEDGLKSATLQVGKALQDPVRGMTALRRVGAGLTVEQEKQVKAFVASGRVMEAQKLILDALARKFGGVAAAAVDPAQRAAVAWQEFKERMGALVIPAVSALANVFVTKVLPVIETRVVPAVISFGRFLGTEVVPRVRELAATWLPKFRDVIGQVGDFVTKRLIPAVQPVAEVWLPRIGAVFALIANVIVRDVIPAILAIAGWLIGAGRGADIVRAALIGAVGAIVLVTAALKAWAIIQAVVNLLMSVNPVMLLVAAIGALIGVIVYLATKTRFFQTVWNASWGAVKAAALAVWNWLTVTLPHFLDGLMDAHRRALSDLLGWFAALPGRILGAVKGAGSWLYNVGRDIVMGMIHGIESMASDLWNRVTSFITDHIPGPVKKVLGLGSPSKLFKRFGRDTIRGYIEGIEAESGRIRVAIDRATPRPPAGGGPGGNGGPRGPGMVNNFNITTTAEPKELASVVSREIAWVTGV